ncbi:MAG: hypothetical protein CVV24_05435 [Ignavibacteriae bacterium HGW-Ignavibacteriae-3]|nr:MAG: hypothetical protein CVV24_05435 [Ignavibacteriae bacterium HGW-Ignavibacteriae-3]
MGQQQLLLILLGIVVVGIAIFVGINLFRANAIETKRNNVTNELVNLASMAQQYYMRPNSLGGGSRSFTGWIIPSELVVTANGHYTSVVASDQVEITGVGNEVVTNNDSVTVKIQVNPTSFTTIIIR